MKRTISWFIGIIVLLVALRFGGNWALTAWISHKKNYEAHSMHEGHVIVDAIKARDPSVNATWITDEHGEPNIVIRSVFDRGKQDIILSWAKSVKAQGLVRRRISVDFQKEMPHSNIPDTILRTEEF